MTRLKDIELARNCVRFSEEKFVSILTNISIRMNPSLQIFTFRFHIWSAKDKQLVPKYEQVHALVRGCCRLPGDDSASSKPVLPGSFSRRDERVKLTLATLTAR